jgi:hypothetical protein
MYQEMPLRDYFAGQAMTVLLEHRLKKTEQGAVSANPRYESLAETAYAVAEAMMQVRVRRGSPPEGG